MVELAVQLHSGLVRDEMQRKLRRERTTEPFRLVEPSGVAGAVRMFECSDHFGEDLDLSVGSWKRVRFRVAAEALQLEGILRQIVGKVELFTLPELRERRQDHLAFARA